MGDPLFTCRGQGVLTSLSLKNGLRMSTSPFWTDLRITPDGLVRLGVPRTGGAPALLCRVGAGGALGAGPRAAATRPGPSPQLVAAGAEASGPDGGLFLAKAFSGETHHCSLSGGL